MTQINSNGHTWLFVPTKKCYYRILDGKLDCAIPHLVYVGYPPEPSRDEWEVWQTELPHGEWDIHCNSWSITEEQAAEIVTNEGTAEQPCYTDYNDPLCGHKSAIQSLQTLLTEHGIEHAVILKKI